MGTHGVDQNDDVRAGLRARPASRGDRVRLNEAQLEIDPAAISDPAIDGLIEDWIVPTIVEKAIDSMIASGCIPGCIPGCVPSPLSDPGFDPYNYLGRDECSGEEFDARASTEGRPTGADPAASAQVNDSGVSGADRASDEAELDGQ